MIRTKSRCSAPRSRVFRRKRATRLRSASTATRPLAINVLGDNLYFPTVDLTKNVCELVDFYGDIAATYDYAPFGAVTAGTPSGSAVPANPFQWSSEVYDDELGLVYYNYRHYSPTDGRFLSRDPIEEQGGLNLYSVVRNRVLEMMDWIGKAELKIIETSRVVKNYTSTVYGWTEGYWSTDHVPYFVCERIENSSCYRYFDKVERNSKLHVYTWYLEKGSTVVFQGRVREITDDIKNAIYRHEWMRVDAYRRIILPALQACDDAYNSIEGVGSSCEEAKFNRWKREKLLLRNADILLHHAQDRLKTALSDIGIFDRPI